MRATCPHCQRSFGIADERLTPGKEWAVLCPACKGRFSVSVPSASSSSAAVSDQRPESGSAHPRGVGGAGCLCCIVDASLRERVVGVLEKAGYGVVCPSSPEQGVEMLRFAGWPLVVYQEGYDSDPGGGVRQWLSAQSGEDRRRFFLVWLGPGARSEEPMFALSKSADLCVDEKEVGDLPGHIMEAQEERKRFYAPLRMVLKELGVETDLPQ